MDTIMMTPDLYKFSNDVRDLYVKTKISDVEDLFVKIAQTYEQNLTTWLTSKPSKSNVKPQISNPSIYEALSVLEQVRQQYPDTFTSADLIGYKGKKPITPYLPLIASFAYVQDEEAQSVLFPYKKIINVCATLKSPDSGKLLMSEIPLENIAQDLKLIHEAFVNRDSPKPKDEFQKTKKETKKEKKRNMFSNLLEKFSLEVQGAARRTNMNDFAIALGNGILANPMALKKYVSLPDANTYMWNEIRRLVKVVLRNLDRSDVQSNYNFIKERSMYFTSMISNEELTEFYKSRLGNTDFSQFMGENNLPKEPLEEETISITDAQLLNPEYLSMITMFFVGFWSDLK